MAVSVNTLVSRNVRDLLEKLAPLRELSGVSDYLLSDREGKMLARNPDSTWSEEVAAACARDMAQVGSIVSLLSVDREEEEVFDFHFKGSLLIAWDLGRAYLLALCSEDANLAMVRMTVNVIKEELRKDRRLRSYMSQCDDQSYLLLSKQHVEGEMYKHVEALKKK